MLKATLESHDSESPKGRHVSGGRNLLCRSRFSGVHLDADHVLGFLSYFVLQALRTPQPAALLSHF